VSVCFISSLKFLLFDTAQMFITTYTRARTSFQCKSTSTPLHLGLPSYLFASGTPTKFHHTRQTAGNSRLTLKLQRAGYVVVVVLVVNTFIERQTMNSSLYRRSVHVISYVHSTAVQLFLSAPTAHEGKVEV